MPILKSEPDCFPDNIFSLDIAENPWWVAHVRSRQEKALARWAAAREVAFYLPQHAKRVRRAGRTFESHLPLFPGYVFFRGSRRGRLPILQSNLLTRAIDVPDQELLGEELSQIRRFQEAGASLVPHFFLHPGEEVRVTEGPFEGYRGVVLQEKGTARLVIAVSLLRKAVAVEFDRAMLAPAHPRRLSGSAGRKIA